MEVGYLENEVHNKINGIMSSFRLVFEKLFVEKDQKINAITVINELKKKEIDSEKITSFLKTLPQGEWNFKVFVNNINRLSEIFGVSDEEIRKFSVTNLNDSELLTVKKLIVVESMGEYARFSK